MRTMKTVSVEVELQQCDRCGLTQDKPGIPHIIFLTASFSENGFDLCFPCAQAVKTYIQAGVPKP